MVVLCLLGVNPHEMQCCMDHVKASSKTSVHPTHVVYMVSRAWKGFWRQALSRMKLVHEIQKELCSMGKD